MNALVDVVKMREAVAESAKDGVRHEPSGGPPAGAATLEQTIEAAGEPFTVAELEADPPPQRFILDPYLPEQEVTLVSGAGGTGKTTAMIQLAVARALGLRFLNGNLPTSGTTVFFSTEERREHALRRLRCIRHELGERYKPHLVAKHVRFYGLRGIPLQMIDSSQGQFRPSGAAETMARILERQAPDADLVVLETVNRLTGGPESNDALGQLIVAAEVLSRLRSAAVAIIGHVSQEAGRSGTSDQYANRGGSAGSDNARSSVVLARYNPDNKEHKGWFGSLDIPPEMVPSLRILRHPSGNYSPDEITPVLLQVVPKPWGMALRPADLQAKAQAGKMDRPAQLECLREFVSMLVARGEEVTITKLRKQAYRDKMGIGLSEDATELLVNEALAESAQVLRKTGKTTRGGGHLLTAIPRGDRSL